MNDRSLAGLTNEQIANRNTTPEIVWKAAYEIVVKKVKGFKTYRRTPALRVEPPDLPLITIYVLRDREQHTGDSNVGDIEFKHYVTLGVEGLINLSDVDAQLETLAQDMLNCRLAIYRDPDFMRLIDGIESSDTRLVFNRKGENPTAGYQMELTIHFTTVWPPEVIDDYLTLHLETRYPTPDTDPAVTPQIVRTWDIPQND